MRVIDDLIFFFITQGKRYCKTKEFEMEQEKGDSARDESN